jgi:hypothetical protein
MSAVSRHFWHSNKRTRLDALESRIDVTKPMGLWQRLHCGDHDLSAHARSSPLLTTLSLQARAKTTPGQSRLAVNFWTPPTSELDEAPLPRNGLFLIFNPFSGRNGVH